MEIRCCCTPEKLLGHGTNLDLPIRTVLCDDGSEYEAYSADNLPLTALQAMEGFEMAHKHGPGGRSWKDKSKSSKSKTWKEEKKKRTWK